MIRQIRHLILTLGISGICLLLTPVEAAIARMWMEAKLEQFLEWAKNRAANHMFDRKSQQAKNLRLQMPGQIPGKKPGKYPIKYPEKSSQISTL